MRLSFTTMGTPDLDHAGAIALAQEHGFAGVDIRYHAEKGELRPGEEDAQAEGIRSDFAEAGLEIPSVLCYNAIDSASPDVWETMADDLQGLLSVAGRLGARAIRIFGGYPQEASGLEAYMAGSADVIRSVLAERDDGIGIYLQNHKKSYTTPEAVALAQKVDHPRFGLVYSPDHTAMMEEPAWDATLASVAPWTREIYVADVLNRDGDCALPGRGIVPLGQVVSCFEAGGFEGFYSFKWEKIWRPEIPEPEVAMPAFIEFMNSFR